MGLTGFVIIHVFIASFSPARGECNHMVNTKFTRPVNVMPMSNMNRANLGKRANVNPDYPLKTDTLLPRDFSGKPRLPGISS